MSSGSPDPHAGALAPSRDVFENRVYRLSHARTAAMFGRERDAASYACRRIEALREDPKFDWQVFEIETLLRATEVFAREARCDEVRLP